MAFIDISMSLDGGARLLDDHVGRLERMRVVESPSGTTHITFGV